MGRKRWPAPDEGQLLTDIGPERQPVSSRRVYESVPTAHLKHGIEYQHVHPLVSQVAAPQDCLVTVIGSLEAELRVEEVDCTDMRPVQVEQPAQI